MQAGSANLNGSAIGGGLPYQVNGFTLPSSIAAFGTSEFSILLWMKVPRSGGELFTNRDDFGGLPSQMSVRLPATGGASWEIFGTGGSYAFCNSDFPHDGTWRHIGFIRSSSSLAIYVNGALAKSENLSVTHDLVDNGRPFAVGYSPAVGPFDASFHTTVSMDDIGIWKG